MPVSEFDKACLKVCIHCRKAEAMGERGQRGHVLRKRTDTLEWTHDFRDGDRFTHAYCLASKLRDSNG